MTEQQSAILHDLGIFNKVRDLVSKTGHVYYVLDRYPNGSLKCDLGITQEGLIIFARYQSGSKKQKVSIDEAKRLIKQYKTLGNFK